MIKDNQTFVC